jgi:peptidyl-prolyl cis-trans isomerase C
MKASFLFATALGVCLAQTPTPKAAKPAATPVKPALPKSAAVAKPAAEDPVVLVVGEEQMTRTQFENFIDGLPEQLRNQARGPAKRQLAEQIVELKILAQEARKRKIDQSPAVKEQIALQIDKTLAQALYQELLATAPASEEALRALYEKNKSQYEQVKARHILVRFQGSRVPLKPDQKDLTDAEALAKAQELRKKILAGEDFASVAKAESDDTGSGVNGGDLGQFARGQMIPQFEEAAFRLPVGQVSEPVKTPFGYHLIRVDAHDNRTYDQMRPELEQQWRSEYVKSVIERLKSETRKVLDEKYFGSAAPNVQPEP